MDLDVPNSAVASGQPVGRGALVLDRQIAASHFSAFRGRARPGFFNHDVAGLEFLRECRRGAEGERERQGEKRMFHCLSFVADGLEAAGHGFTVNSKVPWV